VSAENDAAISRHHFKEWIMVKKFKAIGENQLAQTVKDSAHQIWLAGLGAFAKAQEEGTKVFDALVKEGESIQNKTRKVADEQIAVVTGKAVGTWDRLEQVFEDRVAPRPFQLGCAIEEGHRQVVQACRRTDVGGAKADGGSGGGRKGGGEVGS
jgi:hypothetical protein